MDFVGYGLLDAIQECLLRCNLQVEHQNGVRVWSLSVLSLNEYQNGFRVWSVSALYQKLNMNEY